MNLWRRSLFRRVYRSKPAYLVPEINLVLVDIELIENIMGQFEDGFSALLLYLIHEVLHLISGVSGTVINMSTLSFESIRCIVKCAENPTNLKQTKEEIIRYETANNNVFVASRFLVEALNAYQFERMLIPFMTDQWKTLSSLLSRQIEARFRAEYKKDIVDIKAYAMKSTGLTEDKIPEDLIAKLWKDSFRKNKKRLVQKTLISMKTATKTFAQSSLTQNSEIQRIFDDLMLLEKLTNSAAFSMHICFLALDIPYHPNSTDLLDTLPLQYNPSKRFDTLVNALKTVNTQTPLKNSKTVKRWIETEGEEKIFNTDSPLDRFLKQRTGLETYDTTRSRSIHFFLDLAFPEPLVKRLKKTPAANRDILFMEWGMRASSRRYPRSFQGVIDSFLESGFVLVIGVISNKELYVKFGSTHKNNLLSVRGVCLSIILSQISSNVEIVHPKYYLKTP